MARLIKCPRCQSQIDVTSIAGGSTVKCACGAQVRVPTGQTGQFPTVPAQPAAGKETGTKTKKKTERTTSLFKKMAGVKAPGDRSPVRGSGGPRGGADAPPANKNLIIGGIAAGVLVLVVVVVIVTSDNKSDAKASSKGKETSGSTSNTGTSGSSSGSNTQKTSNTTNNTTAPPVNKNTTYEAVATFEKGARELASGATATGVSSQSIGEAQELLRKGDSQTILTNLEKYFAGAIECILSDEEVIATSALACIRDFCTPRGYTNPGTSDNPINMAFANSKRYRADKYVDWTGWYSRHSGELAENNANRPTVRVDPNTANWGDILDKLRTGGVTAMKDPTRPEYTAFQQLKGMGKPGIAKLISFISDSDPPLASSINNVLIALTGQNFGELRPKNLAEIKAKWEEWVKNNP